MKVHVSKFESIIVNFRIPHKFLININLENRPATFIFRGSQKLICCRYSIVLCVRLRGNINLHECYGVAGPPTVADLTN